MTTPPGFETRRVPVEVDVPVLLRPGPAPEAPLVVVCHGMGQGPEELPGLWPRVCALPVHLLLPGGPYAHEVRGEGGIRIGRAWYLYDGGDRLFEATVTRSAAWLDGLVAALEAERGWKPRERALVGFSQGAYFAYVAALGRPGRFGRLVAVAGRLKEEFLGPALARPGGLRTLILHGERDRAVPAEASRRSHQALLRAGYAAELRILPGGHRLLPDRDERAAAWLADGWGLSGGVPSRGR